MFLDGFRKKQEDVEDAFKDFVDHMAFIWDSMKEWSISTLFEPQENYFEMLH